jgi:thiol-disulfide isomerase/thioredoxin
MAKKAFLLPVIIVLLLGVAAYRLFISPATPDHGINSFLTGEMAKLSLPEKIEPVPGYIIMREDGSPIALDEMKGKVLLVNLWAPWCAPCRAEMPELANLQRVLGDDKFEVIAINVDRSSIGGARETLKEWGVEGLALYAEPTMKIAFEMAEGKLPTSYIIDGNGMIRAFYVGPLAWDKPEAQKLFIALKENLL